MRHLAVTLTLVVFAGCFPKTTETPPTLTPAQTAAAATRSPDATLEALANGRAVYAANCNRCHGYPAATTVTEAEWPAVVHRMGKKASLPPKETNDVLRFILAARE